MEDALRELIVKTQYKISYRVLILILMEDALRVTNKVMKKFKECCLNPYSDGRCSKSAQIAKREDSKSVCLNPYSDGRCSKRTPSAWGILEWVNVLILILMEDALRGMKKSSRSLSKTSLNPYSDGRCSKSQGYTVVCL